MHIFSDKNEAKNKLDSERILMVLNVMKFKDRTDYNTRCLIKKIGKEYFVLSLSEMKASSIYQEREASESYMYNTFDELWKKYNASKTKIAFDFGVETTAKQLMDGIMVYDPNSNG